MILSDTSCRVPSSSFRYEPVAVMPASTFSNSNGAPSFVIFVSCVTVYVLLPIVMVLFSLSMLSIFMRRSGKGRDADFFSSESVCWDGVSLLASWAPIGVATHNATPVSATASRFTMVCNFFITTPPFELRLICKRFFVEWSSNF